MNQRINALTEWVNRFLEKRPGLLPLLGVGLILINLLLQFVPGPGAWIADSNLFLHVGLLVSIIGILLISVYRH